MYWNFVHHEARGDVVIALYEGMAHVEQCPTDRDEWCITGISVFGFRPSGRGFTTLTLDPKDKLAERITLWLYETQSQAISDAWDAHQRETADDQEEAA